MFRNIVLFLLSIPVFTVLKIIGFTRNFIYLILIRDWEELSNYLFSCAHGEDVAACSYIYRTTYKSVSGVTGLKAYQERKNGIKKSYIYPVESLIDWLFSFDPNHCFKAAKQEFPKEIK